MTLEDRKTDEAQIRRVIDDWTEALRAKDIDRLWSHYAPDILSFDLAPPLQHRGELREELAEWFGTWKGPIGYEIRDLTIAVGADVAFSHSLHRMSGTRTTGEEIDVWLRATVCFLRIDGLWRVAHEHTSVPFYMDGSFRAAIDLTP
jgi:ketosteroid isomerase-like protein